MTADSLTNLLDYDRAALRQFFVELGEKPYRADQVMQWIYQHCISDIDGMTNLGKALRTRLAEVAEIRLPAVVLRQDSADGTTKWVFEVDAGNHIESVFIPDGKRGTLCVSSQVGCALDCSFCSTARQGFNRNLTVAEIIGQLWVATQELGDTRITNVVLMGMGEPLLNYKNVIRATALMQDDFAYGLSRKRVTLSTAGVVPALYRLADDSRISLAVSLHAPTDELRSELVPLNRKYPIAELLKACRHYAANDPHGNITFEYVMLDGVNDSEDHAYKLARLLRKVPAKVNLIPFNPFPLTRYRRSPEDVIERFHNVLMASGLVTITRKTRGDDIDAACGQLVGRVQDKSRREIRFAMREQGVNP